MERWWDEWEQVCPRQLQRGKPATPPAEHMTCRGRTERGGGGERTPKQPKHRIVTQTISLLLLILDQWSVPVKMPLSFMFWRLILLVIFAFCLMILKSIHYINLRLMLPLEVQFKILHVPFPWNQWKSVLLCPGMLLVYRICTCFFTYSRTVMLCFLSSCLV